MVDTNDINFSGFFIASFDVPQHLLDETSMVETYLTESILTPVLQMSVKVQSTIHTIPKKNYDDFRGKEMTISFYNPNRLNGKEFHASQLIYRIENRKQINYQVEEFMIHACDPTLLTNHSKRMSKFYKCLTPSQVVQSALSCVNAESGEIQPSGPTRDYQAANIHPFQVIAEQADVALDGTDPSFLHYMTFDDGGFGMHHFKSIKRLTGESLKWDYIYSEKGFGEQLGNPHNIMAYEFPCDFDLLTDILNGVDSNGQFKASSVVVNSFNSIASLVNGEFGDCDGMGEAINAEVESAINSEDDNCDTSVQDYSPLRQARLSLIQPDKISLRLMVPLNPFLHAGDMIDVKFYSKYNGDLDYGSGDYLVVNLTHNIKAGGFGVTTLECVSKSVGIGLT